jgi:WD40 repeat protein
MGVAFSPDGRTLASGDLSGNLNMWEADSGIRIAGPLRAHERGLGTFAFSPGGDRLYSAGQDGILLSWALGPTDLADLACKTANRNLTQEEWTRFLGAIPYQETCSGLK